MKRVNVLFYILLGIPLLREIFYISLDSFSLRSLSVVLFYVLIIYLYKKLDDVQEKNKLIKLILKYALFIFALSVPAKIVSCFFVSEDSRMYYDCYYWIVSCVMYILLFRSMNLNKMPGKYMLFAILIFPLLNQVLASLLPTIVPATPDSKGIIGLLDSFNPSEYSISYFNLFSVDYSEDFISRIIFFLAYFQPSQYLGLMSLLISPSIFILLLFNIYSLYHLFQIESIKPWYLFIPILSVVSFGRIGELTTMGKFMLFIPFVRLCFIYKVNKYLCQKYNYSNLYIWGLTFIPILFCFVFFDFQRNDAKETYLPNISSVN